MVWQYLNKHAVLLSFCAFVLAIPAVAVAQDGTGNAVAADGVAVPAVAGNAAGTVAPGAQAAAGGGGAVANASQATPRRSMMRRTIENREFDDRDKIILLLNAHCDFPTREDLLLTSDDAEKHLHSIFNDDTLLYSVRQRALEALAYFDTPQNVQMLEQILAHPEQIERPMMLMQAIIAYPKVSPETAPAVLEPFLASDNDMIRFVTISSLKKCPGNAAVNVLRARYEVEGNRFFKMRLKNAIEEHCKQDRSCRL